MKHEHNGGIAKARGSYGVITTTTSTRPEDRDERLFTPRAWQVMAALIGALVLAIIIAGLITIIENNRVKEITERALSFDIEVEDEASDV